MADLSDCITTPEQTLRELEEIERKLALKYSVEGNARLGLFRLETDGKIDDDDPEVRDWHAMYSRHLEWLSDRLDGEVVPFELAEQRLVRLERKLAARHGITQDIRQTLIARDQEGQLVEDELVADWHDAYASYINFLRERGELGDARTHATTPGLYGECHNCKRYGRLRATEFSRDHNPLRGAVCESGCEARSRL
jgi:hypothetical protein